MNSIVRCPVCQQSLSEQGKAWHCENNHHYDVAKQGYCNLLLANQKGSATPGDDANMLQSRHVFLSAGHYQPVSGAINRLITKHCSTLRQILDLGCGEGYYLSALKQQLNNPDAHYYGTDISKQALKLAARHHKSINWFVAAAKNQPFLDHQLDLILNIFAPADWHEIQRILKPEGHVLLAVAGSNHLQSLRELIYESVNAHQPERFIEKFAAAFELIESTDCQFTLQLADNESIRSLLHMTPYFWQAGEQCRQSIEDLQSFSTPVNVRLYLLKLTNSQSD
ncbi:MAG: methyltransferase domain-containing protein [Gammaproteobacteria bacterium]|nr:methyltransferase domain-containing protein [Gammaproteobacteria bacterium]